MNTSRLPARHATRSILMIACLASVTPAQAIDVVWQGGNGAWSEARWSSGSIADGAAIHALIDGGNVLSSTVHLDRNAAIGRVTLSAADTLVISGGYTLSLLAGGVSGPGTLRIDGGVGRAALVVSDGVLSDGLTQLVGPQATVYGGRLAVASGHTLRGSGHLGDTSFALLGEALNAGTVRAEGSQGLSLAMGGTFSNQGVIEVEAGSRLHLAAGVLSGSVVRADAGPTSARLSGGSFRDLTLEGLFDVHGGDTLVMAGAIGGPGTLRLQGQAGRAALVADGTLNVDGAYGLHLAGDQAVVYGGQLHLNGGMVTVDGGRFGDATYAALAGVRNRALIEVYGGELGVFTNGGQFLNEGQLRLSNGAGLRLTSTTFSGGSIDGLLGGRLAGGTFRDTALLGSLAVASGDTAATAGVLTLGVGVDGTSRMVVHGSAGRAAAVVDNTTLAGSGEFALAGSQAVVYGNHLTIGSGVTLQGQGGHLGDGSFALLGGVRNEGRVHVRAAGLSANLGGGRFDNQGLVQIDTEGGLRLTNSRFEGGVVRGSGLAAIAGNTFADTRFEGSLRVRGNDTLATAGTIVNPGTLTLEGSAARAAMAVDTTTLAGSGSTRLQGPQASIYGNQLTIAADHRLVSDGGSLGDGSFALLGSAHNLGLLRAEGSGGLRVRLSGGPLLNEGRVEIAAPSALDAGSDTVRQAGAAAQLHVDGSMRAAQLQLLGGTLSGAGQVRGATQVEAATIAPGAAAGDTGTLSFAGGLTLGAQSLLKFDLAGLADHDRLLSTGPVALAGTLLLDVAYAAQPGDTFTVFSASDGALSGSFDQVLAAGWSLVVGYSGSAVNVTLSPVPEPGRWGLMLAGLLGVGAVARRRLRHEAD